MSNDTARMAVAIFDPARLQLARKLAGRRKVDLAREVGVTPGALSQYEHGTTKPSPAVLARLALALGLPAAFFAADGRPRQELNTTDTFFRSLRAATQLHRDQALAHIELVWEVTKGLEQRIRLPANALPSELAVKPGASAASVERAAELLRVSWNMPPGPVAHVVRLVEAHGVVVALQRDGGTGVDAFSRWIGGRQFVVLCSDKGDAARSRFDAAHELGHSVLHPDVEAGSQPLERQAHIFAAAFLMPRDAIESQLPRRLDWEALIDLKARWGVSIQALLYRARSLGTMTEATYRRAMTTMSKFGWRRAEPGALGKHETPRLLGRAVELLAPTGFTTEVLAAELRLPVSLVREIVEPTLDDRATYPAGAD